MWPFFSSLSPLAGYLCPPPLTYPVRSEMGGRDAWLTQHTVSFSRGSREGGPLARPFRESRATENSGEGRELGEVRGGELQQPLHSAHGHFSSEAGGSPSVTGLPPPESPWGCRNQQRIPRPPTTPSSSLHVLSWLQGRQELALPGGGPIFPGLPTGFSAETRKKAGRRQG